MAKEKEDKNEAIIKEALQRFERSKTVDADNRKCFEDDQEFIAGDQWDPDLKEDRLEAGRPCLVINKLPNIVARVTGEHRMNKIGINVIGVDKLSDPKVAEIQEGILRDIEYNSFSDIKQNKALESATQSGRGWLRLLTQYCDDKSFDQEIRIGLIDDISTVYYDVDAPDKMFLSDAKYNFISYLIPKEDFKERYPNSTPVDSNYVKIEANKLADNWYDGGNVRISEYWRRVLVGTKKMFLFDSGDIKREDEFENKDLLGKIETNSDGTIKNSDLFPENFRPMKWRNVEIYKVEQYIISGRDVLDGPIDWIGETIPITPVWGREITIEGDRKFWGIIRFAKDSQRMYNSHASSAAERMRIIPVSRAVVSDELMKGHENDWLESNQDLKPCLKVNHDALRDVGGRIAILNPPPVATGESNERRFNSEEIHETTGIYPPSLGEKSSETSGVAIKARQTQSSISTYDFYDNLVRTVRYMTKKELEIIPKVYKDRQVVRIVGIDESVTIESLYEKIEVTDEKGEKKEMTILENMQTAKYDLRVKPGPGFESQRIEAQQKMFDLIKSMPDLAVYFMDILMETFDFKEADRIAKRLSKVVPPNVLSKEELEEILSEQEYLQQFMEHMGMAKQPDNDKNNIDSDRKEKELRMRMNLLDIEKKKGELDLIAKKVTESEK